MAAKTTPAPTTTKVAAPKLTKQQLTTAAKMRDEGATWNAIREATGTKYGSSAWFKMWTDAGIDHRPANTPKPKTDAVKATKGVKLSGKQVDAAAAKPTVKVKRTRTPQKAAKKPLEGAKKPQTQTARKGHPRTSNGRVEPVTTTIDEAIKAANERGAKVAPNGGQVTKESVQANWDSLSDQEREGFAFMGWAPAQPKVVA